jgi:hypothetical protein
MGDTFILKDGKPVHCNDLLTWGKWMATGDRIVAKTQIGDADVSTVFLGLDHGFGRSTPILFETMVFGGALDGEQERYATRDEAQAGHDTMVERVKEAG